MGELDTRLFLFFNQTLTCGFLDQAMPFITDLKNWLWLLVPLYLWLLVGGGGRYRRLALLMALAILGADRGSAGLLKPLVDRPRPCCAVADGRKLIECKKSRSFPSSHAANTAAVAGVAWFELGACVGAPLAVISVLVAWSRVYVGVHYPGDVLAGMLFGWLVALAIAKAVNRWWKPPQVAPPDQGVIERDHG